MVVESEAATETAVSKSQEAVQFMSKYKTRERETNIDTSGHQLQKNK